MHIQKHTSNSTPTPHPGGPLHSQNEDAEGGRAGVSEGWREVDGTHVSISPTEGSSEGVGDTGSLEESIAFFFSLCLSL